MNKIKLSTLRPYVHNAKNHPEGQIKKVAASIKEFGFNQPIVVDKKGVIIVGHGRYAAAKLLGLDEVPVLEVELTEEQANAYRLADNKLNESEWDMQLVIEELKLLSPEMVDLTGFADSPLELSPEEAFEGIGDDKSPFEQITFTLSTQQAETVKEAMGLSKSKGKFDEFEGENENSNGNAIARICEIYIIENNG